MDLDQLDLERLKQDVSAALADGIADLVEGSQEDVQSFTKDIARDILVARLTGQTEVTGQLLDQLRLLAEINRVRAENHTWTVVETIVRVGIRAAVAGALSVFL